MRCLVTGGAGFIGSHLVEHLLKNQHEVVVLDDFSSGKLEHLPAASGHLQIVRGSILDQPLTEKVMQNKDWVFHLAGLASVQASMEDPMTSHAVNATGTLQILWAAKRAGVLRVVYAASSSAYGNVDRPMQSETDPLSPCSPYAAAKLAGELYSQAFTAGLQLPCVRLRFFNVYGPRQDMKSPYSGVIARFANLMSRGERPTIFGDGLQSRDFVYVADVCAALVAAAQKPWSADQSNGELVYNIGTGHGTNLLELVHHLNTLLSRQLQPIFAPAREGDIRRSCANIHKAQTELGYQPRVDLRSGLQKTLGL